MQSNLQRSPKQHAGLLTYNQPVCLPPDSQCALADATPNDTALGSDTVQREAENLVIFLDELANVRPFIRPQQHHPHRIHAFMVQAGSSAHFAPFVHKFLEHEKSWFKLQPELTQFVACLSQVSTDASLDEGQNLRGKRRFSHLEMTSLTSR